MIAKEKLINKSKHKRYTDNQCGKDIQRDQNRHELSQ